ncbi:MAG: hypothetical protein KJN90_02835 [Gammaproteobacteria bacterium]|nr:hypothetical protein [Gammaproteobacteria bacterium]
MKLVENIEGIMPALAVIILGMIAFIVLVRRQASPERPGFVASLPHVGEVVSHLEGLARDESASREDRDL